jgi:hypothetical protein
MPARDLKVIFIRHAEKPLKGDNLNCQGLNRSMQLPGLIVSRFGVPDHLYVPHMGLDTNTRHSRMFQTIIPLAVKYNLGVNSNYEEKDSTAIARNIEGKTGTVVVTWEHKAIAAIVRALGIEGFTKTWPDDDYESIWVITFHDGRPSISFQKEGLMPAEGCPF